MINGCWICGDETKTTLRLSIPKKKKYGHSDHFAIHLCKDCLKNTIEVFTKALEAYTSVNRN